MLSTGQNRSCFKKIASVMSCLYMDFLHIAGSRDGSVATRFTMNLNTDGSGPRLVKAATRIKECHGV